MSLYTPLEDDQIRLLQVLPRKDDITSSIECLLSVVSLQSDPEYCALSYTWGSAIGPSHQNPAISIENETHPSEAATHKPSDNNTIIIINGHPVVIRHNLWTFLDLCASSKGKASPTTTQSKPNDLHSPIWIDALCIDQENLTERCQQISLMGRIYQSAQKVLIWLGAADEFTSDAFELIAELDGMGMYQARDLLPRDVLADSDRAATSLRHWTALGRLFYRNWFQRSWIWQEVIFARQAVVLCGDRSLRWQSLVEVSGLIATSNWKLFLAALSTDSGGGTANYKKWYSIPTRIRASWKDWKYGTEPNLLYAMIRARHTLCTDLRDKVYAHIHLGKADIVPDYTLTTREVYIQVAEYILDHRKDLYLLACCEGRDYHRLPGLPTWAPDWHVNEPLGLGATGYEDFMAAGYRPRVCAVSEVSGRKILTVEAAELDVIDQVCPSKAQIRQPAGLIKLLGMVAAMDQTYRTGERIDEVLWRVLMTNRSGAKGFKNTQHPAHPDIGKSFRAWIGWRLATNDHDLNAITAMIDSLPADCFTESDSFVPSRATLSNTVQRARSDAKFLDVLMHDAAAFELHYSHSMNLRPFRTCNGYLGLGTTSLIEGDSVKIVSGSRVPLIFRRTGGTRRFELVGAALVHSFMRGQFASSSDPVFDRIEIQ